MKGIYALWEVEKAELEKASVPRYLLVQDHVKRIGLRLWRYENQLETTYKRNIQELGVEAAQAWRQLSLSTEIGQEWKKRMMERAIKEEPKEEDQYVQPQKVAWTPELEPEE